MQMMAVPGSIRRKPHSHSGAARLWQWAHKKRSPWSCADAAEAAGISPRRCRMIVAALHQAGLLTQITPPESTGTGGFKPAQWQLSKTGQKTELPPIMTVEQGIITGIRLSDAPRKADL